MEKIEIYLVPGFLGFDAIASLHYFEGVKAVLEEKLRGKGTDVRVIVTETVPTGSIAERARRLAEQLVAHHDPSCDSVHLLGHSTGGLDIRLLLSPGSVFEPGGEVALALAAKRPEREREHVLATYAHAITSARSAMSLATPHYGTPAAQLILDVGFDRLLRALASLESPRARRHLASILRLASAFADGLEAVRLAPGFLVWMNEAVLSRRPDGIIDYLRGFGDDLGALRNLTVEAASLFNAAVERRAGVDYVSFCTANDAPKGPIESDDPFVVVNTLIYRRMWAYVGRGNPGYPYSTPAAIAEMHATYERDVRDGYDVGTVSLGEASNDGLVPTSSQVFGRVGAVVASDHLDCIGMYRHDEITGWIVSGARFDRARFELLYGRVADTVRAAHLARRLPAQVAPAVA